MAIQTIKVDITPSAQPAQIIYCSQGDIGRTFEILLYDGASTYTPPANSGMRIVGKKSDKNIFEYYDGVTYSGNSVTITTQEQMTACAGPVVCELQILDGNNVIGTANFILLCEGGTQDGPYSESVLPMLARAEQAAETVEADIAAAQAAAQTATSAASSAQTAAGQASASATNAASSEQAADNSADSASDSAALALTRAQAAETARAEAVTAAGTAQSHANAASQSESNASQYASDAQEYASRANASATAAASDASDAATAKTQAQTAANQARQFARPTVMETQILASDWDASTHKVTISASSITLLSNVVVTVPEGELQTESTWLANNEALANACIYPFSQQTGSITLYAVNVPTTDLYVRLIISGGNVS